MKPVVATLIALNVLMYVLVGASGAGWMDANARALIGWGSNFGPLTGSGEWWRLLTAMFLHGGLVHLGVNMLTLADVGSMCERLYGSGRFLVLYLLAGLLGSAASVWWNPGVNSVGASGAIFGVLGALLVFLLDRRNGIPAVAIKAHVASLGVFVAYGLVNGFTSQGIDNMAHLGGLCGGVLAGWALAPAARGGARAAAGILACAIAIGTLASLTPDTRAAYEQEDRFFQDVDWLKVEERRLNDQARRVFTRAREPGVKDADLKPAIEALALAWADAYARFSAYTVDPSSKAHELHANMVGFLDLRRRAMAQLVLAVDEPARSREHMAEYARLTKEANAVAAKGNPGKAN